MNSIPLAVLNRALLTLDKTYERLSNPYAADPYVDVVKSRSELGYYVNKIMDNTSTQISLIDGVPV